MKNKKAPYKLVLSKHVTRFVSKLSEKEQQKVMKAFEKLSNNTSFHSLHQNGVNRWWKHFGEQFLAKEADFFQNRLASKVVSKATDES